jgi:hypothetical protein
MTMTTTTTTATTPDYDEIVRVVQLYVDGFNDCDIVKFKQAFHENAWIFFTDAEGTLRSDLLTNCFEEWATPPNPKIVGRIISVTQAGDVANVLLGFDNADDPASSWVDFHNLLRIDGVWKITNKSATHSSQAAWARAGSSMPATTPDFDEIVRVAQLYIDGFNHDIAMLKEAFHEDAWIFYTDADGTLYRYRIWDQLDEWVAGNDRIEGGIISVRQSGDVANVLLRFAGDRWIDFHSLLRIDGVWKITNKTATHGSRAAWASAQSEEGKRR